MNEKEKKILIDALSFYYERRVWDTVNPIENASDVDVTIRSIAQKLGIKKDFPIEIQQRW